MCANKVSECLIYLVFLCEIIMKHENKKLFEIVVFNLIDNRNYCRKIGGMSTCVWHSGPGVKLSSLD